LAIVAYRQPITRLAIEEIRGVDVSAVLHTLLERRLIRITGRDKGLGRPLLYGTTEEFLRYFGLNELSDLPTQKEIIELLHQKP
jgi:segregation and condensation protein B